MSEDPLENELIEELTRDVCVMHETVVKKINSKATSKEMAMNCMAKYDYLTLLAIALQSTCDENGNVDEIKAMKKLEAIEGILYDRQ